MNSKRRFLLIPLFLLGNLFAQSDALLWRIEGKGLEKPSYLFGTVHAHCKAIDFVKPEMIDAVQGCDYVVLELDLNDFGTMVALTKSAMKPAARPLSEYLNQAEALSVDSALQYFLGDSLKNLQHLSPMTLMSKVLFSEKFMGCTPIPVDLLVAQVARELKKETAGLESFGFQDSLLGSVLEPVQVNWLKEICMQPQKARADLTALLDAYNSQSASALYDASLKSPEMALLKESLLDKRNRNWVQYLLARMPANPLFVAVGAAHLGGSSGLLELLRQSGYTLTPIPIKL